MSWTGGCLCGAVRYRVSADPFRVVHCHCGICRRHSGAAFMTFVAFRTGAFEWMGEAPARFRSSAAAERGFCARCGSTLAVFEDALPDWTQVALGSLDRPGDVRPDDHVFTESRLAWLHVEDGLPRHPRLSPRGGREEP
jgi:hypothetical protein